ncbi:hypothetical protein B1729_13510 [Microbacterium sp. B35-04]|uniref:hypothetical protein n=1 Tax=unclassified Microbacterium TaxID=2609290 RepID=UPI0013D67C76|nr:MULTISPECIES: hypothetical protein [unclassified Microbacterium]KAF2412745.1 hypothetical protein B1729_13510 [Microbacterium sp. B35-04]KAF2417948.1 hypothetical protein B2K11_11310 [Microbacterium sp. B35-30]
MTAPDPYATPVPTTDQAAHADSSRSSLLRAAIWVAIGALIAAAIVCVLWVLLGTRDANDIVGRAFLTILLLAGFAGVAILDAHLAPSRPAWFALASMASWIIALLLGAIMIWMPERYPWLGFSRFIQFLLIVLILQLVLLHVRFYLKAFQRYDTPFTRTVTIITITLVIALAVLLIIPLAFGEWLALAGVYWRIVVAIAILAALGTALVPLVNVLFAPKKPRAPFAYAPLAAPAGPALGASAAPAAQELLPWPTYVDAVTPLPMLPDGSPDWNAYYTGYPSPGAHVFTAIEPAAHVEPQSAPAPAQDVAPVQPTRAAGYEGYPPPPPLPPLPPRA